MFQQQFEEEGNDNAPDDDDEFNLKLEVLGDVDSLKVMLDTYKETMETKITAAEKTIVTAVKREWEGIINKVTTEQHKRNRTIVKEIIETCHEFRQNLKSTFDTMRDELDVDW